MTMQSLARALERVLKARLIPEWRLGRYGQTAYVARLIKEMGIDSVLDVGANTGQYRDYLRMQVGFRGRIVSFEPHPVCVAALQRRLATDALWSLESYALGSTAGSLEFNLTDDSQFSSFLTPVAAARGAALAGNRIVGQTRAQVRTLDEVFPALTQQAGLQRPLLKLDTQGFDLEVLAGAVRSCVEIPVIQSEVSNVPIYDGIPSIEETLAAFRSAGFELAAMFPTNPEQFPAFVDFDAYFLRGDMHSLVS